MTAMPKTSPDHAGLWAMEEDFWLEGPAFYRAHMAPDAVMSFPDAVGTLKGEKIVQALENAPRWGGVRFSAQKMEVEGDKVVLHYHATARRDGQTDYEADCQSVYVSDPGGFVLSSHIQHTA